MRDRGIGSRHFESRDNVNDAWRTQRGVPRTQRRAERTGIDELASYNTDFDLQVALEQDESQGLYDYAYSTRAQVAVYGAAPVAQRTAAGGYALPQTARAPASAQRTAATRAYANQPAVRGFSNVPQRTAANASQLAASRSPRSGIRNAGPAYAQAAASSARQQPAPRQAPQPSPQRTTARQVNPAPVRRAPLRMSSYDEPVRYPEKRGGWLGKLVLLVILAGAAYCARDYLTLQFTRYYPLVQQRLGLAPAVPPPPPPAAVISQPEPAPPSPAATPAAAAEEAPAPAAAVVPQTPQERRAAARAARLALVAERKREREEARAARLEARRARAEAHASNADAPSRRSRADSDEPAHPAAKSWKTDANDDVAPITTKPARMPAADDSDLLSPPRAATADNGTLRINSRPWSVVYVDGQAVGHTPQLGLTLPPGDHQITLVNDEMQLSKSLTVNITSGATVTRILNLAE